MNGIKYIFYFSPHQDDELLNLGVAMCKDIDAGYEVFCVLCTDGGASGARRMLCDGGNCAWHEGCHKHPLEVSAFSAARDREFTASCLAMGVKRDHILIPGNRAKDRQMTAAQAAEIMRSVVVRFPAERVTIKTLSEVGWGHQNNDHTAVARAAIGLCEQGICSQVEEYLETILFPPPDGSDVIETLTPDRSQEERLLKAAACYWHWEPEVGSYAIGYHSVADEFIAFRKEQYSRLCISEQGSGVRSYKSGVISSHSSLSY